MTKELSFKNLPFKPVTGQVIYIEQNYDDGLNKFIRSNYNWLKDTFKECGLDFCYLPLLAEELVSYNVPFLSSNAKQKAIEQIVSLDKYLPEDTFIVPSLVFGLTEEVKDADGDFVLHRIPIEISWYNSKKSVFKRLAFDIERETKELTEKYRLEKERKARFSIQSKEIGEEQFSLKLNKEDLKPLFDDKPSQAPVPTESNDVQYSRKSSCGDTGARYSKRSIPDSVGEIDFSGKRYSLDVPVIPKESEITDIRFSRKRVVTEDKPKADDTFEKESQKLMKEVRERIAALRNMGVNSMILRGLLDEGVHVSRISITKDFRIFLLDYNNMEITMTDLPKAVFLLFLHHPEGIAFKCLTDYKDELWQIYRSLKPRGTSDKQRQSISDLVNPFSNSINEKCARIREAFISKIDISMAKNYYVTGKKGEAKRISLDQSMVIWEK